VPELVFPQKTYTISRNIALLDTNVLVAFVLHSDPKHEWTVLALEDGKYRWAVSYSAAIEAWNLLVGREKAWSSAHSLITWLLTPGNEDLIDDRYDELPTPHSLTQRFKIDVVDANLMHTAHQLTNSCNLLPAAHVATYDTKDFYRCFGTGTLLFNVLDMKDLSSSTGD
jgi:hypothetical protein